MDVNSVEFSVDDVGFIVPTLGKRVEYLQDCLKSIRNSGCKCIYLVGPKSLSDEYSLIGLYDQIIDDKNLGLTKAINLGVESLPNKVKFFSWLGDDDLVSKDCLDRALAVFQADKNVVAVFGGCEYIDENGKHLFYNMSGQWAALFMGFLPNLIPQPGSLIKRSAFNLAGKIRDDFPLAFDFDLFFELRKIGRIKYVSNIQGSFRWHSTSLSVKDRELAVTQSSRIRKRNLPNWIAKISFLWEPIICKFTLHAANIPKLKNS